MLNVYAFSCKTPHSEKEWGALTKSVSTFNKGSLVCFPEYFIDGVETYDGRQFEDEEFVRVSDLAKSGEIYIASGMVEMDNDNKYIAGILLGPDGNVIGKQRKIHVNSFERKNGIISGGDLTTILKAEFGTVSFSLCKDQWYPDNKVEAELLIHLRGFGLDDERFGTFYDKWLMLDQTTAMLKKAYLIGATGAYGKGVLSDVIDFEGSILAEDSDIASTEIHLELLRKYRTGEFESKKVARF